MSALPRPGLSAAAAPPGGASARSRQPSSASATSAASPPARSSPAASAAAASSARAASGAAARLPRRPLCAPEHEVRVRGQAASARAAGSGSARLPCRPLCVGAEGWNVCLTQPCHQHHVISATPRAGAAQGPARLSRLGQAAVAVRAACAAHGGEEAAQRGEHAAAGRVRIWRLLRSAAAQVMRGRVHAVARRSGRPLRTARAVAGGDAAHACPASCRAVWADRDVGWTAPAP